MTTSFQVCRVHHSLSVPGAQSIEDHCGAQLCDLHSGRMSPYTLTCVLEFTCVRLVCLIRVFQFNLALCLGCLRSHMRLSRSAFDERDVQSTSPDACQAKVMQH
eukprot:6464356-Amphidinium_carterae.1